MERWTGLDWTGMVEWNGMEWNDYLKGVTSLVPRPSLDLPAFDACNIYIKSWEIERDPGDEAIKGDYFWRVRADQTKTQIFVPANIKLNSYNMHYRVLKFVDPVPGKINRHVPAKLINKI